MLGTPQKKQQFSRGTAAFLYLNIKFTFWLFRLTRNFILHRWQMAHASKHRAFANWTGLVGLRKFFTNPRFTFSIFTFQNFGRF